MRSELILVDREALLSELRRAFDPQTAEILLGVLDKVAAQVRVAGVTREDFSELKQIVAELAEAQRRTEQRLERLESVVEALFGQVHILTQSQQRTEDSIASLTQSQQRMEESITSLTQVLHRTVDTVGGLKGRVLEWTYRDRATAYFGRLLRRTRVVAFEAIEPMLEAHLSAEEFVDVMLLDLLVSGQPRQHPEVPEVWLAVEVSAVVDEGDVTRARRRAALLRQVGYRAIPVVAGEQMTLGAETEANLYKVVILQDGRSFLWDEALTAWAKETA